MANKPITRCELQDAIRLVRRDMANMIDGVHASLLAMEGRLIGELEVLYRHATRGAGAPPGDQERDDATRRFAVASYRGLVEGAQRAREDAAAMLDLPRALPPSKLPYRPEVDACPSVRILYARQRRVRKFVRA